ncbi:membrane bound O-acyl transferase family-domain-containing protein [Hypoxylon cercidicola]|nr:membrane bound O-acyl transferase family-domain-containing protein [Hypoxylon cercidicola]
MSLWAQSMAPNIVHIASLLFIERWPTPLEDQKNPPWSTSLRATYRLWGNPRLLSEASTSTIKNVEDGDSLAVFLLLRLTKLTQYYLFHTYVIPCFFAETIVEIYPEDVDQTALLTRLSDVTAREVVVRSWFAIYWIWESVAFLDGANAALASFAVLAGLDREADWPPLFGQPVAACGLLNFWSQFWHQLPSRPYKCFARAVIGSAGSNVPTPISRALLAFVVFLLSGLSHMTVSWQLGMRDTLDLQWFLLNFVGCMVERVTLSTVRHLAKRAGCTRELKMIEQS